MPTSHDMSPWTLIADASLLVQVVMAILAIASLASWFLIVQRGALLARARRALDGFEQSFRAQQGKLEQMGEQGDNAVPDGARSVFQAGYQEFLHLSQGEESEPDAVLEGSQRAMRVAISREEERLGKHLAFLATVGSVSPYIGLFGTVWGIMNAFIGLAQVQQATLAAVAPGIAEALIATAIGLFAAIPAVIAYNRFSSANEHLVQRYYTFAEEFSVLLHRRLHGRAAR
ncbi:MAG: protein TolQ [Porticoccaceae bacterium]